MARGFCHILLLLLLASYNHKAQAVGLKCSEYFVGGNITIEGQKIIVDNFGYTGKTVSLKYPDAFFYVGRSGCPSGNGTRIQYPPGHGDRPLGAYSGQRVELELPTSVNAEEVAWVSIWSGKYKTDFGHAFLSATDMDNCGNGSSPLGMFVHSGQLLLAECICEADSTYLEAEDGKPNYEARKSCDFITDVQTCAGKLTNNLSEGEATRILDALIENLNTTVSGWDSSKCPALRNHIERTRATDGTEAVCQDCNWSGLRRKWQY